MKPAEISGIGEFTGQEVTLKGWVYNMRSSGKLLFLQMRDGTGIIQCIIEKAVVGDEDFELASGLTQESSLAVTGMVKEDSR
ncbi:MAG: asparagine--tRNA ligase, partial [Candidatus Krumholzibacteria bacterium]|nr:asparagine--tRNA ligase [Candidatus Krumholzibacteria bacterium]